MITRKPYREAVPVNSYGHLIDSCLGFGSVLLKAGSRRGTASYEACKLFFCYRRSHADHGIDY